MAAVGAVHEGDSRQLQLLNSAYIVLLPKKEEPLKVGDPSVSCIVLLS